jgi:hypothetical protein
MCSGSPSSTQVSRFVQLCGRSERAGLLSMPASSAAT